MTSASIREHLRAGQFDKATDAIKGMEKGNGSDPEAALLRGYLQELTYDTEAALGMYQKVLDHDPDHSEAAFRAAYLCDLGGDDDTAISLYERCTSREQASIHALINLAVLYEEMGAFRKAERCLKDILSEHPNHTRARQLLKSVQSTSMMVVDERGQRDREHRSAILDQPITDFELSVRSRNCLRQMNIRTLGDLARTTEAELLAYKNFGETSLNEIKALLVQKGLKLGLGARPAPGAPSPMATSPAPEAPVEVPAVTPDSNIHLHRPVAELELSVRSRKCLQRLGITTIGELIQRTEAELMTIKNFGQTSLTDIKQQLGQLGLSLRKRP